MTTEKSTIKTFSLPPEYPNIPTCLRTHTCGELRIGNIGATVTLCGWVHHVRDKNHFCFIDLRDRFGSTQLVVNAETQELYQKSVGLGREFVLRATGKVVERSNKSKERETGDIEVIPTSIEILNKSLTPPFLIEDETDGREELRMKYRYLDIRRNPVKNNLLLRHKLSQAVRNYLSSKNFIEIETPYLIKSTPEGARDFIVPSRMNPGSFYALPQSPQTFKQLLMVAGMDRYYQIVRCFRDEELRSDRQPEFTQIDCEMTFVDQEDVIQTFEGMVKTIFKEIRGIEFGAFPRMEYADAMKYYGIDKPDTRFESKFVEVTDIVKGKGFPYFDNSELVVGVCFNYPDASKKQLTSLSNLAKSREVGATSMVWVQYQGDGKLKSGVDKFYNEADLKKIAEAFQAKPGDLMMLIAGRNNEATRVALGKFRLAVADEKGLRDPNVFKPLWVVNFPLLEYNEEDDRWQACHHPFTSALPEDWPFLWDNPGKVRARAYDLVINGSEVGGGSIRIHDKETQLIMLKRLGLSNEDAEEKFGFLMKAFEFGAPPHGGLAFGLDRLCAILGGDQSIRSFIAFPKNKEGRDTMIEAPSSVDDKQLQELNIRVIAKTENAAPTQPTEKKENAAPQKTENVAQQKKENATPQKTENAAPQKTENATPQKTENAAPQKTENAAPQKTEEAKTEKSAAPPTVPQNTTNH